MMVIYFFQPSVFPVELPLKVVGFTSISLLSTQRCWLLLVLSEMVLNDHLVALVPGTSLVASNGSRSIRVSESSKLGSVLLLTCMSFIFLIAIELCTVATLAYNKLSVVGIWKLNHWSTMKYEGFALCSLGGFIVPTVISFETPTEVFELLLTAKMSSN